MNRRNFLAIAAGASAATGLTSLNQGDKTAIPIIDTHIHLFDTNRPEGVPWPTKQDTVLYQPALPERYRQIAAPLGVVGAIVVEASPWLEDNQWVLDVAARDKIIVGTVGNLEPGQRDFRPQLERFQRNPLFRGIRNGNLWERDLGQQLSNPQFVSDLRFLAQAGLTLDAANPNPALLASLVRVTDQVPDLRVIIDHLPQMNPSQAAAQRRATEAHLKALGQRPQVYVKISEVLRRVDNGTIPRDLSFYRARLDELFGIFGEDRLLYGSDWPNSDRWLPFHAGLGLVKEYFNAKSRRVAEKYFWKNSVAAYKWQKRDPLQPE
ncbi:putative TIM-barrel fold metal-dependent hydrolase [Larkinella arboricola]|uniref:Putative TIM-barrel fold metal-dependent hydrolase n=1 Tax=Larkinella arboricola TaxID=643671 RepID=A0A327WHD2_LARAB|nr:amidohydrolase family protein [Larkinella arboricola]RAJ90872.1 putative TIM-barrel fold metal-dependent hydrolase [Larkinella arboricola]